MKKILLRAALVLALLPITQGDAATYVLRAMAKGLQAPITCAHGKQIFDYTGADQTFTVPTDCSELTFKVWGAAGGGTSYGALGGGGGYATGSLAVNPGQALKVVVGNGGIAGSGQYIPGGGGGYTGVFNGSTPLIIAGAGGGAGYALNGGGGGGLSGDTAPAGSGCVYTGGGGGSQTAGGGNGTSTNEAAGADVSGSYLLGGDNNARGYANAGITSSWGTYGNPGKGTGGSGYYGGGPGAQGQCYNSGTGGGGGSSYIAGLTSGSTTPGDNAGNPGNASDPDRGTAGASATTGYGQAGRVVITW